MAYENVRLLRVYIWDHLVGVLAELPGGYFFEFDQRWIRTAEATRIDLAPRLMPLSESVRRRRSYNFGYLPSETFHGLPPMLADSAPDAFGNTLINAALAREGMRPEDVTPIDRLAYVGKRGMGALTFEPDTRRSNDHPTSLILSELVEVARAAVVGNLAEDTRTESLASLLAVGSSAGGARPKAIVAWNRETNDMCAGGIPAPFGYEQWLLKFDGVESKDKGMQFGVGEEYGRIEYAYNEMARAVGLDVPETFLLEEDGRAHFMVRRFDRMIDNGHEHRIHMQTLCAIDGLDYNVELTNDYASLMVRAADFAERSGTSADESAAVRQDVFRRMVFNVLGDNNDDHTKNHAFLLDTLGGWHLSPVYDITHAYNPNNRWLRQHLMGVGGKYADITKRDLIDFAERFEVYDAMGIINQVSDVFSEWPRFAKAAGVSPERSDAISDRLIHLATVAGTV